VKSPRAAVGAAHDDGDRETGAEWGVLGGGRRARSDARGKRKRNGNDGTTNLQPMAGRSHFEHGRGSGDRGPHRGADWANVGIERARVQINAAVQLRRKKNAPEEY
jgi:hypothetical protein